MKGRVLFTITLALIFLSCNTYKKTVSYYDRNQFLVWNENEKLDFSDFKLNSKPLKATGYKSAAVCATGIWVEPKKNFRFIWDGKSNNLQIFSFFDKNASWFEKKSFKKEILEHEQLHFDISEVVARRFREKLNSYSKALTPKQLKIEYEKFNLELNKLQEQYDSETKHGVIDNEQFKWKERVKFELINLNSYKKVDVFISSKSKRQF